MSFKRVLVPQRLPRGEELTSKLIGCGFMLSGKAVRNTNIEDCLFAASVEGMNGDLRVLSLLVDWLGIHSDYIIADRVVQLVTVTQDQRVRAFWASIGHWKKSDPRLKRLRSLYKGPRVNLLPSGTDFHLKRSGEDRRFQGSPLVIPRDAGLRQRANDILSPAQLARLHRSYYYRLIIGPTYRADMWAALELDPGLTTSDLARACYGSFATAWSVKHEREIVLRSAA